jgi:hypothetical protein
MLAILFVSNVKLQGGDPRKNVLVRRKIRPDSRAIVSVLVIGNISLLEANDRIDVSAQEVV